MARARSVARRCAGAISVDNAATALAALAAVRETIPVAEDAVRRGLAAVRWPGRLDVVGTAPLTILDGAHNRRWGGGAWSASCRRCSAAGRCICCSPSWATRTGSRWSARLAPLCASVVVTEVLPPRGAPAAAVARGVRAATVRSSPSPTSCAPGSAVAARARPEQAIVAAGSLFLVGALYATVLPAALRRRRRSRGAASVSRRAPGARPHGWRAAWRSLTAVCGLARAGAQIRWSRMPPEDEITVDAESLSYDKKTDTLSASGDVVIRRGESVLRADEVQLDRRTNEAQVLGDAVLTSPEVEIRAEYDVPRPRRRDRRADRRAHLLRPARLHADRRAHREARRAELPHRERRVHDLQLRRGSAVVEHRRRRRSTWRWTATAISRAARSRSSTARCCGCRAPRSRSSTSASRACSSRASASPTGAAFSSCSPTIGRSTRTRTRPISLDIETSLRIGLLGEYRYAFSESSVGAFEVGYFNEAIRGQTDGRPGAARHRSRRAGESLGPDRQPCPGARPGARLRRPPAGRRQPVPARDEHVHLRASGTRSTLRTLPFTTSRVGALQDWNRVFVQAQATTTRIWSARSSSCPRTDAHARTAGTPTVTRRPTSSRSSR